MWEPYKFNTFVSDYHTTHMQETAYSLSLFQTMVPLGVQQLVTGTVTLKGQLYTLPIPKMCFRVVICHLKVLP